MAQTNGHFPNLFVPAWYLPKGTINASDEELDLSAGSCEKWALFGGLVVIGGVLGTVLIAWIHPIYDSSLERWGSAISDIFVAVGIAVELLFAHMGSRRQSTLSGRLRTRAVKAERETEMLRKASAWRVLSTEQHTALTEALRSSGPGASVLFWVIMNEPESLSFAYNISHPFRLAGWKVGFNFNTYTHDIVTEILLPEPNVNWLKIEETLRKRVWQAFVDADIAFVNGWTFAPNLTTSDNAFLTAPIAHVYVGPKPAPILECSTPSTTRE